MLDVLLDLFFIQLIWVIIADLSGFNDTWKSIIKLILTKGKMSDPNYPGFNLCSLCLTWWSCLLYLIITGNLTLMWIAVSLLISFFTGITRTILIQLNDLLTCLITWNFGKR